MGAACAWWTSEGWTGRRFHLGDNKEAFDAESFAIYQALWALDSRQEVGRGCTVFSDSQSAIRRSSSDELSPGQQWAGGATEVCARLMSTERRPRDTAQSVAAHVRPERSYTSPGGSGLRRGALRKARKSLASRYYQLLSGHSAIGSFLHERMTGPQRLEPSACWWCNSEKRQSRNHLFTECNAWAPHIRSCGRGLGKTASGSTQGRHRLGGCGKRRPLRQF